ncbi:LysR family transcriptional regulator ArgP [Desulfogranum marinum]|uniref:LysR family transcriptional regulator ArgP n=1 Tax=Desulfogranum marinum TaxID=453220 RepID=UPI001964B947|nr:LysR family transcriptional regulator ArgP [Desulfogranum marinum]MBM9514343.1 LysR family transcriptional regulator ArgP [Desulfogranum marinum]
MFDYKLIKAMATVVLEQGFEKAAQKLYISQSAVSQRVKLLEEQTGRVLLVRSNPPVPTDAGRLILKHYQQVMSLEKGMVEMLDQDSQSTFVPLTIGLNADSLATWFVEAVVPLLLTEQVTLDLLVDDQEQTLSYLKAGEVMGCVSSHARPVQGCTMHHLGTMHYRLLATRDFCTTWFPEGLTTEAAAEAPAVVFNRKDGLHQRLLEEILTEVPSHFPVHYIPSSEQFVELIRKGQAYGSVPDLQGCQYLLSQELVELVPEKAYPVPLFWHVWSHRSRLLEKITKILTRAGCVIF